MRPNAKLKSVGLTSVIIHKSICSKYPLQVVHLAYGLLAFVCALNGEYSS